MLIVSMWNDSVKKKSHVQNRPQYFLNWKTKTLCSHLFKCRGMFTRSVVVSRGNFSDIQSNRALINLQWNISFFLAFTVYKFSCFFLSLVCGCANRNTQFHCLRNKYQTRGRLFHQISKHWEVGWKTRCKPSFFFTYFEVFWYLTGLEIRAGQRTLSGLIVDLTGQTFVLPVILIGQNSIVLKRK